MPRTYKGRTPEEQREFNRQRREQLKVAREQAAQGADVKNILDEFEVNVEAEDIVKPQLSWKDRVLSRFQKDDDGEEKPPTKIDKEHVEKSEKLLSHILPVTLSALLALYSQRLFSDDYKSCAPTRDEIAQIITPIFTIISRHVGVEGRATQDALDMGAILLASITVGTRMLMTAEQIRKAQNETGNKEHNISQFSRSQGTDNSKTYPSTFRSSQEPHGTEQYRGVANDGTNGNGFDRNVATEPERSDADKVAQLMRRDTLGRRQMGLAPRVIREED